MTTLTADDADKPVSVAVGEDVAITLTENPTTGFHWTIDSLTGGLTLVSSEFERPPSGRPGAGGLRTITIRASAPGPGQLQLQYGRAWKGGPDDVRRTTFAFAVKSA